MHVTGQFPSLNKFAAAVRGPDWESGLLFLKQIFGKSGHFPCYNYFKE